MSHTMTMTVVNNSSQVLQAYNVSHEWDGNTNSIVGKNLSNNGGRSAPETITSGHTQYDNYDVSVTFADGSTFHTSFYCNSSYDQDAVDKQINNNDCNCVYYKGGGVETGCYNKG